MSTFISFTDVFPLFTIDSNDNSHPFSAITQKYGFTLILTLSQITNFRLFQTKRVCRRQLKNV